MEKVNIFEVVSKKKFSDTQLEQSLKDFFELKDIDGEVAFATNKKNCL